MKGKTEIPQGKMKITPTPETQWGEWEDMGTSTVNFPVDEFLYTGTLTGVPTYLRHDASDPSHSQYKFEGVLPTNTAADIEPNPLLVDVYGNEVTVYSQPLPPIDLGAYNEFYPGPFAVCDWAVLLDMESYRMLNQYTVSPMSMSLSLVIYDESQGEYDGMIFMGDVKITSDNKAPFSIPEEIVIGGDMGMGLLKVEADEEVWSIKYATVKGDGNIFNPDTWQYETAVEKIIAGDPSVMTMMWMAGDIMATPMEGAGRYTLAAVAYDENDKVLGSTTCAVYNMPNESWLWTPKGEAVVSENLLSDVFDMNLTDAGIPHGGPVEYKVEVEENLQTPGLYRLKNLYGSTHPYSSIFEFLNDFPVYTYFDCTRPGACYIYNMPTGFIVKGDDSGEILLGCEPSIYFDEGWPFEMVFDEMPEAFGSFDGKTITFTPEQLCLSVPVLKEFLGYDWYIASMFTSDPLTVTLPEGNGVGNVSEAAAPEYFDLNGRRVANPDKGIYIVRKGENVVKAIR